MKNTFNHNARPVNLNGWKGWLAESLAKGWYLAHGYTLLSPRRHQRVQTDILARRGQVLVVAEVKFRQNAGKAQNALGFRQHQRLRAQAGQLAAQFPHSCTRFDVVHVFPHWPFIHVIQNVE